jgi:hypothetical protein
MDNDANKLLNYLFNKAKNEPSKVSFEETKERFLTSVSTKNNATQGNNFARFFNLKLIIMIASIITTVALVLVLKPTNTTKTVEKVKVSGNTLSFSIEDENGYGVDITYTMKKTPKGITVSGEWERHTSSMSTRNSIGNTKPKSFKDMNEVLTAFAKALNKTDLEALKKINI